MEIDIEALIAGRKQERERRAREAEQRERDRSEQRTKLIAKRNEVLDREFRRRAATVVACVTQECSPDLLHNWFLLDHWTAQEGLVLLCGFDPKHVPFDEEGNISLPIKSEFNQRSNLKIGLIHRLDGLALYAAITEEVLGEIQVQAIDIEFRSVHRELLRIWKSGSHTETRYPPKYFIDWAIKKKLFIPWLEWAKTQDYYDDPSLTLGNTTPTPNGNNDVSPRSETAYLHIIGALCELYWNAAHEDKEYSQTVLLSELEKYDGFYGMSERNLKDKLTRAMRAIRS